MKHSFPGYRSLVAREPRATGIAPSGRENGQTPAAGFSLRLEIGHFGFCTGHLLQLFVR